jgi:hypothetical protein
MFAILRTKDKNAKIENFGHGKNSAVIIMSYNFVSSLYQIFICKPEILNLEAFYAMWDVP